MSFTLFFHQLEIIMWNIALALLISGGILVIISIVLNIESLSDAFGFGDSGDGVDADVGIDGVDADVSIDGVDADVSIDGVDADASIDGVDADTDISAEHDSSTELGAHHIDMKDVTSSAAPLFLILSTYFLIFGILGVVTLKISGGSDFVRVLRIIGVIGFPYILANVFSRIWRSISKTTSKQILRGEALVGEIAEVFASVDYRGGLIHVNLGQGYGTTKLHAKPFSAYDTFQRGEKVKIVAVKGNEYLVDKL